MTNRGFILNCIAGLSDKQLLTLWDSIFDGGGMRPPIISACETEHSGECPGVDQMKCVMDADAWMKREAVLRSG